MIFLGNWLHVKVFFINFVKRSYYDKQSKKINIMKRFIVALCTLLLCCGIEAQAQVLKFDATDFAYRTNYNGRWSDWTDWEDCSILVVLNTDKEEINIYSAEPQELTIYAGDGEFYPDNSGGKQAEFKCVDLDGQRCTVRIRIQGDGQWQLYVDYSNISYVYCIEPR